MERPPDLVGLSAVQESLCQLWIRNVDAMLDGPVAAMAGANDRLTLVTKHIESIDGGVEKTSLA